MEQAAHTPILSFGLWIQVFWAEMPQEALEVALKVVRGQGFGHILQVLQVNALAVPVLHHSPLLGAGLTHGGPAGGHRELTVKGASVAPKGGVPRRSVLCLDPSGTRYQPTNASLPDFMLFLLCWFF